MDILDQARQIALQDRLAGHAGRAKVINDLADRFESALLTLDKISDQIKSADVPSNQGAKGASGLTNVERLLLKMKKASKASGSSSSISHSQVLRLMQPMKAYEVKSLLNSAIETGRLTVSNHSSRKGPDPTIYHIVG